jgi:spore coat protein CotH
MRGVKIKIAGRGTRYSNKASYKINIDKEDSLFGYQKIKLRSLVTDPSYMREKVVYDFIGAMGLASSGYSYAR